MIYPAALGVRKDFCKIFYNLQAVVGISSFYTKSGKSYFAEVFKKALIGNYTIFTFLP